MSGAWKESISLEETNKIRISLGLKPLADPNSAEGKAAQPTAEALAESNYAARRAEEQQAKADDEVKARIAKAKNQRERVKKLAGVGLGDESHADEEEKDAKAWVKRQKKMAKLQAARRAKEQEEADAAAAEEQRTRDSRYGEKDLTGLKMSHDMDAFEEGEEVTLTLKDSRVLDDEEDELHNLNMTENAKHEERVKLKKQGKSAGYTGYDDDEFAPGGGGVRGVLSKYDEEIEGKEAGFVRLGGPSGESSSAAAKEKRVNALRALADSDSVTVGKPSLSLDYDKTFASDYLQEGDVGFKKPKKKKTKRSTRQKDTEDDTNGSMAIDEADEDLKPIVSAPRGENLDSTNLIDDDDLQAALARARREQVKKRLSEKKRAMPVDEVEEEPKEVSDDDEDDRGLVLDDTSEFVRAITSEGAGERRVRRTGSAAPDGEPAWKKVKKEGGDVPIGELDVEAADRMDEDEDSQDEAGAEYLQEQKVKEEEAAASSMGTESYVSGGLAATMNVLRHQGLLQETTPEERAKNQAQREKDAFLAARRKLDAEYEEDKRRSKLAGDSKDQATREWENKERDRIYQRASQELFAKYRPEVEIKRHDEFGRDQTTAEAWKQLSHSFHGYGSGKGKTEKRLKKIEDERKREAMQSGDTPLSTAAAFAARAERTGSATMILGVGNSNSAPALSAKETADLLGPNKLQRTDAGAKKKDKKK